MPITGRLVCRGWMTFAGERNIVATWRICAPCAPAARRGLCAVFGGTTADNLPRISIGGCVCAGGADARLGFAWGTFVCSGRGAVVGQALEVVGVDEDPVAPLQ